MSIIPGSQEKTKRQERRTKSCKSGAAANGEAAARGEIEKRKEKALNSRDQTVIDVIH